MVLKESQWVAMLSTKAENCLALQTQKDVKAEGGLPKKHLRLP